jgi:ABC-type antimicrobial peptide transport system permease subunit
MRKNAQSPWITVVGVTDNTRLTFSSKPRPEVFVPLAQEGMSSMRIIVKTRGNPTTFAPALKRIVSGIDPDVPVAKIDTMSGLVAASVAEPRFNTGLLSTVAALAAGLAAIGIFGVTAYVVGLRSREFGIRLALGARPSQIRQLVIRQGLVPIALGLVAGLSGAWLLTGVLKSQLVETAPHDPLTFALAPATFFAIGLLACWIPARRTSRVDPVSVLKAD